MRGPDSQRAIAQALSVSMNTVKTHRASIYRKLNVSCRQDAVARAIDLGLISPRASPRVMPEPHPG